MKISVIGTGYVGLVTGACFAELGNDVTCIDCNPNKIDLLKSGDIPIYEPGLQEIVTQALADNRLHFTLDITSVRDSQAIFICVGTPTNENNVADMTAFWKVIADIRYHLALGCIIVIKSTVPVGTNKLVSDDLNVTTIVSNPEFLKEGVAINDFMKPDRIIIGTHQKTIPAHIEELYRPFLKLGKTIISMSPESAEMTKYVSNSFLATKISFINEMANICSKVGADINEVRRGIGSDQRIGFSFLFPGIGYGGSCFPKDIQALSTLAKSYDIQPRILEAVSHTNDHQKYILPNMILDYFNNDLKGKKIAVWGLAFKPGTDDIREAPSIVLIKCLLNRGAEILVHDPAALENMFEIFAKEIIYCKHPINTLYDADALAICTEWKAYTNPDFTRMKTAMKSPVIFDGRNIYTPDQMKLEGFTYFSIGQQLMNNDPTATNAGRNQFIEHLERASETVRSWPRWKQNILGG